MTKRMFVTIGYNCYTGSPDAIAALIALAPRLQMVKRDKYDGPWQPHPEPTPIVQSMDWGDFDRPPLPAAQPGDDLHNKDRESQGIEIPARIPADAATPAKAPTLPWDEWLAAARALPGGAAVAGADLRTDWAAGMTTVEAVDSRIPF